MTLPIDIAANPVLQELRSNLSMSMQRQPLKLKEEFKLVESVRVVVERWLI